MARDMTDKEILKMELEQLKKEVNTPRTPVKTIAFVEGLLPNDPLIKGVPDDKNPYKGEKGGCIFNAFLSRFHIIILYCLILNRFE
uniref:G protein gamma domain-containing protein n=1 Tax=Mastacembelus armatus TaxID=205130 RepID=A0A3Q3RPC9_9TELE